jgi:hypothetical protein
MRTLLAAASIATAVTLTGCSGLPATDAGDKEACEIWSKSEQAMVQTVAIIVELAKDPAGLTEDVATEFNTKRNELLAAYDQAKKVATSPDLKAALENGIDKDSVVYYDLAGATNERIQESMAAVSTIVAACAVAGVDVADVLGTN